MASKFLGTYESSHMPKSLPGTTTIWVGDQAFTTAPKTDLPSRAGIIAHGGTSLLAKMAAVKAAMLEAEMYGRTTQVTHARMSGQLLPAEPGSSDDIWFDPTDSPEWDDALVDSVQGIMPGDRASMQAALGRVQTANEEPREPETRQARRARERVERKRQGFAHYTGN